MAHASLQLSLARAASEHVRPKLLNFPLAHAVGTRNNAGGGLALRRSQQAPADGDEHLHLVTNEVGEVFLDKGPPFV